MNDINHKRGRGRALSILSEYPACVTVCQFTIMNRGNTITTPRELPGVAITQTKRVLSPSLKIHL